MIGRPPVRNGKPALGAPVHASIDGTVTAIADGVVWIEQNVAESHLHRDLASAIWNLASAI